MLKLDRLTIKQVSSDNTVGTFKIGPLPRGYGYTVANSLRRVLLSSLPGGAVTGIRINGVDHEYTTVPGVQDDILTILIKLKGLAIRCYSDEPVIVRLNVKSGKSESKAITAADIEANSNIEVINPDYVITNLDKDSEFSAELVIERGVGFVPADSEKRSELAMIPVDGSFSPVVNVDMKVSNARVGHKTDFDQIDYVIKTNGVMTPAEALGESLQILNNLFEVLVELSQGDLTGDTASADVEESAETVAGDNGAILVKSLKLSTRLKNALTNSAIVDLRVLEGKTKEQLLEIRGMGEKSADELVQVLKDNGLSINE